MDAKNKSNNQKVVYVLGAGASCASENKYKTIKNPLDNNFWQTARDLGILPKDSFLRKFLEIYYGNNLFQSNNNIETPGMEDVYTFTASFTSILKLEDLGVTDHLDKIDSSRRPIALLRHLDENNKWENLVANFIDVYSKTYDARNGSKSLKYFLFFDRIEQELLQLIYEVFKKINCENGNNWNCNLSNEYIEQLKKKEEEGGDKATVISFNYDLLIDKAFASKGMSINKDYSYYLWLHEFGRVEQSGEQRTLFLRFRDQYDIPSDKIELLKLHGSINWFALYQDNMKDPKNVFYQGLDKKEDININEQIMVAFENENGNRGYMVPRRVIIPPIIDKLDKFTGQVYFESLWRRSFEKLKDADRIVFIGYSMPIADYLSKWLFKTALSNNRNVKVDLCLHKPIDDEDKRRLNAVKERYESILEKEINYKEGVDFKDYVEAGLTL